MISSAISGLQAYTLRGGGSGRTVLAAGPGKPSTTTRICVPTRSSPLQAHHQGLQAAAAESLPAMRACSASAARTVVGHAAPSHQGRSAGRPTAPAPRNAIGASASSRRSVATAAAAVRPHCCLALCYLEHLMNGNRCCRVCHYLWGQPVPELPSRRPACHRAPWPLPSLPTSAPYRHQTAGAGPSSLCCTPPSDCRARCGR